MVSPFRLRAEEIPEASQGTTKVVRAGTLMPGHEPGQVGNRGLRLKFGKGEQPGQTAILTNDSLLSGAGSGISPTRIALLLMVGSSKAPRPCRH